MAADSKHDHDITTNTAFLFIKPHACKAGVEDLVAQVLAKGNFRIERQDVMTTEQIDEEGIIDRHYSVIARYAIQQGPEAIALSPAAEATFAATFQVDWKHAVEKGIVLNAKQAANAIGISGAQLGRRWSQASGKRVKLAPGLYAAEFTDDGIIVINGFYLANREKFTQPNMKIHWYVISWDEHETSWKDFRANVIGGTNPAEAPEGSLRRSIYDQWELLSLAERPNVSDNGVHASAGPIEGLAERMVWLHATLRDDFFANALLLNGVSASLLEEVVTNPVMTVGNKRGLAFDLLEDMQSSEVAVVLKEIAEERSRIPLRNHAFVFIKPHAVNHSTKALAEATFALHSIRVDWEGTISAETMSNRRIVDRHYAALARYAMEIKPSQITLDESAQAQFEHAFHIPWVTAVKRMRVFNALDAAKELGDVPPRELWLLWSAHEKRLKLASGLFVSYFDEMDIYVINGFYLLKREAYLAKGASVAWFSVSWDEKELSWKDFRALVIGDTNPADAVEGSIRRSVYNEWKTLGLKEPPNRADNIIHASASPLESLAERNIWLHQRIENDLLCRTAEQCGASPVYLHKWCSNPRITIEGSTGNIFEIVRDWDTSNLIRLLRRAEEESKNRITENTAFVFIKPHAVNNSMIELVSTTMKERGFTIEREGSIGSEEIEKRKLIDRHYKVISHFAMDAQPSDGMSLTKESQEKFFKAFRVTWQEAVHEGRVCNAVDAAIQLGRITPQDLSERWAQAEKVKLAPGLYVGLLPDSGMFVLNGFYLVNREAFTTSGARVHWFVVSWKEDMMSWKDFRANIIGPTNPADAPEGSLRRSILDQWRTLGLKQAPNVSDNGVHGSAGPLEGLHERQVWLGSNVYEDKLGVKLMFAGIPEDVILSLVSNPQVTLPAAPVPTNATAATADATAASWTTGNVFDLLEDVQTSDAARIMMELYRSNCRALARNHAFVFIKPHAVTPPVQLLVEQTLESAGISIDGSGSITSERIYDERLVDQHYCVIARYALEPPSRIVMQDSAAVKFEVECGVAWSTALSANSILSAVDAVSKFGEPGLAKKWAAATVKLRLAPGLYVGHLPEDNVFVVNGFYPGIREKFTAPGKRIQWYEISWDEVTLTWVDFRSKIIGSTNPSVADDGSLRRSIFNQWRELELYEQPTVSDNGVHASAGPFEGLAERRVWRGADIETDVYAQPLMMTGMKKDVIETLLENPIVSWQDKHAPVFDVLEDLQSSQCAAALLDIQCLVQTDQSLRQPGESGAGASAVAPVSKFRPRNTAFVFVKPHAVTSGVLTLLDVVFKEHKLRVDMEGEMISDEIAQRRIIDRHYATIAKYAEQRSADTIKLTSASEAYFKETFNVSWQTAVADHMVLNAAAASKVFELTPDALKKRWDEATTKVKLAPGLYIARFLDHDVYVINGFYLANRAKFTNSGNRIHWFVLSWAEDALTWADFRNKVIGPTNPQTAAADSIRGTIYREFSALGLTAQPDTADNGVHASAGPLEGFAERRIWLGTKTPDDIFGKLALQRGASTIVLDHWASNPIVSIDGKEGFAFDLLEDTQTTDVIRALVAAEESRKAAPAMNTAFAFIKPHAINRYVMGLVEASFHENKIEILQEGDIHSDVIASKGLIDKHYNTIAKYAMHSEPKHLTVGEDAQNRFRQVYAVSWAEAVTNGMVYNAVQACTVLGDIDAVELNRRWSMYVNRVKLAPGMYVTEFVDEGIYVINGFYLLNREKFTAPSKRIHWYTLSWKESDLSWKDFRAKIIGGTDPERAESTSIRSTLLRQWEAIGLESAPNVSDNGIHASAGPLEGLAERMVWLDATLEDDVFGRTLLANGGSADLISDWVTNNPLVALPSSSTSSPRSSVGEASVVSSAVFDQLEDLQSSQVVSIVREASKAYAASPKSKGKRGGGPQGGNFDDNGDNDLDEKCEAERLKATNCAFLFIKPHACTKEVASLVESTLHTNGLHTESSGVLYSYDIEKHGLLDQHYSTISKYAMDWKATTIQLSAVQKQLFLETFGASWDQMVAETRVLNAVDAAYSLGHLSAAQLAKRWVLCPKRVTLAPGLYVGWSEEDDLFLINGFYLFTREKYLLPEKKIQWYVVSWKEQDLSWQDFRSQLIGVMNPAEAAEGSLRNNILKSWRALGLEAAPSTADNGVHVSASPLEGLRERRIWLKTPFDEDLFGRALLLAGCDIPMVERWCENTPVHIGEVEGYSFELVEDKQSSEVVNILTDATAELLFEPIHHISVTPKRKLFQASMRDLFINAVTEEELRELFHLYDPEDTGSIDRAAFRREFEEMENYGQPPPPFVMDRLFTRYDKQKNGRMRFEEFTLLMMARQRY